MLVRIILAAAAFALFASACGGGAASAPAVTEEPVATEATQAQPTATEGLPKFTTEECAYMAEVQHQSETLSNALTETADLMSEPQFFSDEWIFALAVPLATFQLLADDAGQLSPPESLQDIHNRYVGAVTKIAASADLVAQGIADIDAAQIDSATDLFLEATNDFSALTPDMVAFGASRSGSC